MDLSVIIDWIIQLLEEIIFRIIIDSIAAIEIISKL
jgi:hypothetical protein